MEHTYDGYHAAGELFRVLRAGGLLFVIVPDHARLYGDTFVEPHNVVPLGQRHPEFFEDILFERNGIRSQTPRNQFPFTMRLLVAILIQAGFEVQWALRIARNGPELWAAATKPEAGADSVQPLITRAYNAERRVAKLWRRLKQSAPFALIRVLRERLGHLPTRQE